MYEDWFGLRCRPFCATPDPECWVSVPSLQDVFDQLCRAVETGQNISLLTAPPGMGKSLVCLRLAVVLDEPFACALLPNANFVTRRSLLQAILYELGHPYANMSEQELRLALTSHARGLLSRKQAVLLIVDEGHLLSDRLLEELRGLTNLSHEGRPMFRLVVTGDLALEERLAEPQLAAFNQRVGCQAVLPPLTAAESRQYVDERIERAGGVVSGLFTAEAIELICRASDGNPRCINQLADHALMLACAAGQKRADAQTVRSGLDELRQLPLCWNEPPQMADSLDQEREPAAQVAPPWTGGAAEVEPASVVCSAEDRLAGTERDVNQAAPDVDDEDTEIIAIEVGAGESAVARRACPPEAAHGDHMAGSEQNAGRLAVARQAAANEAAVTGPTIAGSVAAARHWTEEPVFDRYARLDAGLPLDERIPSRKRAVDPEPRVIRLLDQVEPLVASALSPTVSLACPPQTAGQAAADDDLEGQIGSLVLDTCLELGDNLAGLQDAADGWIVPLPQLAVGFDAEAEISSQATPGAFDIVEPEADEIDENAAAVEPRDRAPSATSHDRIDTCDRALARTRYARLFSQLRRRRIRES